MSPEPEPNRNQWRLALVLTLLLHPQSTLSTLGDATNTSTNLTQVGIAANCDAFTHVSPLDTCDEALKKFQITISELTTWNPVLGYPDGKYCPDKFWAYYDYCVGVKESSPSNPVISAPPPGNSAEIAGKTWTTLPDDGSTDDYVVNGISCTNPAVEFYPDCWQKLNMNKWLPKWYLEEPPCQDRQKERGCKIVLPQEEAWTTTLLREYVGAGGVDCTTLPGTCGYSPDPHYGEEIPGLARARYRYAHYNIFGKFSLLSSYVNKQQY